MPRKLWDIDEGLKDIGWWTNLMDQISLYFPFVFLVSLMALGFFSLGA